MWYILCNLLYDIYKSHAVLCYLGYVCILYQSGHLSFLIRYLLYITSTNMCCITHICVYTYTKKEREVFHISDITHHISYNTNWLLHIMVTIDIYIEVYIYTCDCVINIYKYIMYTSVYILCRENIYIYVYTIHTYVYTYIM